MSPRTKFASGFCPRGTILGGDKIHYDTSIILTGDHPVHRPIPLVRHEETHLLMQEMMKSNAAFKQSMGFTTSGVSPCEYPVLQACATSKIRSYILDSRVVIGFPFLVIIRVLQQSSVKGWLLSLALSQSRRRMAHTNYR